jgi:hypothetical protein
MLNAACRGVQLTGVHGAGKSAFLEALVGMLCVGGPTDTLYASRADALLMSPSNALHAIRTSSGSLNEWLAAEKKYETMSPFHQDFIKELHAAVVGDAAPPPSLNINSLQIMHHYMRRAGRIDRSVEYHVLVLDEVNEVLKRLDAKKAAVEGRTTRSEGNEAKMSMYAPGLASDEVRRVFKFRRTSSEALSPTSSAARSGAESGYAQGADADGGKFDGSIAFFQQKLPWTDDFGGTRSFQILAASPDGDREADLRPVSEGVFFELRPARADHLAAIILCAPDSLALKTQGAVLEPAFVLRACAALAANLRYVRFLFMGGKLDYGHLACMCGEYATELSRRLRDTIISSRQAHASNSATGTLMHVMLCNASMVVRANPRSRNSKYFPVGLSSMAAAIQHSNRKAGVDSKYTELATLELRKMNGDAFEDGIQNLLQRGYFPEQWWLLSDLHRSKVKPVEVASRAQPARAAKQHGSGEAIAGVECAGAGGALLPADATARWCRGSRPLSAGIGATVPNSMQLGQRRMAEGQAAQGKSTGTLIPHALHNVFHTGQLSRDGSLLVRTYDNCPGVDMLMLERKGNTCVVTMVETTVSSLCAHAANKDDTVRSSNDSAVELSLSPSVRDVVALLHKQGPHLSYIDDKELVIGKPKNSEPALKHSVNGLSIANTILAVLGVPVVVHCQISQDVGSKCGKSKFDYAFVHCFPEESTTYVEELFGQDWHIRTALDPGVATTAEYTGEVCSAPATKGVQAGQGSAAENLPGQAAAPSDDWWVRVLYVTRTSRGRQTTDGVQRLTADFVWAAFVSDEELLGAAAAM